MDAMGALSYRVWYYAALQYDEDQRDNAVNARRQQVQILFARQQQASAWFNPELLAIPLETVRAGWSRARAGRVPLRDREPVPRAGARARREGERLLSLAGRLNSVPYDSLRGADDGRHDASPTITLSDRRAVTLTYGQYRALLETNRGRRTAPRRTGRSTSLRRHARTPTRRSTTACCSATGSMRGRAATRPRSTRRCTATTSRPRSSRT
jgi:oligoendopeptidase F